MESIPRVSRFVRYLLSPLPRSYIEIPLRETPLSRDRIAASNGEAKRVSKTRAAVIASGKNVACRRDVHFPVQLSGKELFCHRIEMFPFFLVSFRASSFSPDRSRRKNVDGPNRSPVSAATRGANVAVASSSRRVRVSLSRNSGFARARFLPCTGVAFHTTGDSLLTISSGSFMAFYFTTRLYERCAHSRTADSVARTL